MARLALAGGAPADCRAWSPAADLEGAVCARLGNTTEVVMQVSNATAGRFNPAATGRQAACNWNSAGVSESHFFGATGSVRRPCSG